jgi:hypothetical protein
MINMLEEKDKLINILTEQYSKSLINLDDFEKSVSQVNKVESVKELKVIKKEIYENADLILIEEPTAEAQAKRYSINKHSGFALGKVKKQKYETVFSWRSITTEPVNGHAGKFSCVFGGNQIKVKDLPMGKTVMQVECVFGTMEIFVPKEIKIVNKITPILAGVFMPAENDDIYGEDRPELHIKGEAVFGNITITRT